MRFLSKIQTPPSNKSGKTQCVPFSIAPQEFPPGFSRTSLGARNCHCEHSSLCYLPKTTQQQRVRWVSPLEISYIPGPLRGQSSAPLELSCSTKIEPYWEEPPLLPPSGWVSEEKKISFSSRRHSPSSLSSVRQSRRYPLTLSSYKKYSVSVQVKYHSHYTQLPVESFSLGCWWKKGHCLKPPSKVSQRSHGNREPDIFSISRTKKTARL